MRGQRWLCPVAHTWCQSWEKAQWQVCEGWQPGLIYYFFIYLFLLLLKKWSLFESTDGRMGSFGAAGGCLSPALVAQSRLRLGEVLLRPPDSAGLTEALCTSTTLCSFGCRTDLFRAVWPFGTSRVKIAFKAAGKASFLNKFNLIFFLHPNLTWKWL